MKTLKKVVAIVLVVALSVSAGIFGTLAYLTDEDEAVNIAVVGNVEIEQHEKDRDGNKFVQGQKLLPIVSEDGKEKDADNYIDKIVTVENKGDTAAYVRTFIAVPKCSEPAAMHYDMDASGAWEWDATTFDVTINEEPYVVYVATHKEALEAGKTTVPSLEGFYMDKKVDYDHDKHVYTYNKNVVTGIDGQVEIYVATQAVQYDASWADAEEALDEAFYEPSATANPWTDGIKVPVLVSTTEEFIEAFEAGEDIALVADIELPVNTTLTVEAGKDITVNLNGHKLTAMSSDGVSRAAASNKELFLVKGRMTVEGEGEIEYSYTGTNMEWNAMTTVFDITAGGELNIKGATVRNLGGTDMNFVAHLNNWGTASLYVEDATLYAPYCAIRVFNSGYDMNTVVAKDSSILSSNRALWVHNYTLADFGNDPAKAEAAAKRLNIDIDDSNIIAGKVLYGFYDEVIDPLTSKPVTPAATNEELKAALAAGEDVYLTAGEYTFPSSSVQAGATIICEEGTTFEGNSGLNIKGATVVGATFSNDSGNVIGGTINGTFKDCTFDGSNAFRYCYAGETVVFENCVFSGDLYGVHFDGGDNDAVFRNCTFSGFNAFGSAITKLTLDGCTFVANGRSGYNGVNLWGSTDLVNCTFVFDGTTTEWVDACSSNKVYNFTNCVVTDGTTETPIKDVFGNYGDNNTIIIDGVTVDIPNMS
ncbi:MAG: right-handed parallel beta-helix repeat-containing protein [Oscillospiraceae bacterium]|nr:right-handed parallel beta-helix repeat-containing protein [Oscillospiraceae bacterium]